MKKYLSKQSFVCFCIIFTRVLTFIYLIIIIETNIVTNIIMKTLYRDYLDSFLLFFSHHYKGSFDFFTLVFPWFPIFLLYLFPVIFIFHKTFRPLGLGNTMRLLKECPSIFLFSIHTNMIFVFDPNTTENKPGMKSTASALQLGRQEPEKTTDEKSLPYKEGNLDKDQGWPIQSEL